MTYPAGVTPNYSFKIYNATTDAADSFLNFRLNIAGADTASNFYMIDDILQDIQLQINNTKGFKLISAVYSIANVRYEANATGIISAYDDGTIMLLKVDTTNTGVGSTKLYLSNLSDFGDKNLQKVNAFGTNVDLAAGDLSINKYYLFIYSTVSGTWVQIGGYISESEVFFSDITTNNVSTSMHGYAPKAVAPSSGNLNVYGIANGETTISNKSLFDTASPLSLGSASSGSSLIASRKDHVHPMPSLDGLNSPTDITTLNVTTSAHGLAPKAVAPSSGNLNVYGIGNGETTISNKTLFDSVAPQQTGTASSGSSIIAARRDHVHSVPDASTSSKGISSFDPADFTVSSGAVSIGEATTSKRGLVPAVQTPSSGYVKVVGVTGGGTVNSNLDLFGTTAIVPQPLGTSASAGTALTAARVDHVHTFDFLLLQVFS